MQLHFIMIVVSCKLQLHCKFVKLCQVGTNDLLTISCLTITNAVRELKM